MPRTRRQYLILSSLILLASGSFVALMSQTADRDLIRQRVDETKRVTLGGNTRPEVGTATDAGEVSDSLPLDHMMLQLKRSPEQEKEVEQFSASLQNPSSPNFHRWLTATEFGEKYGASDSDLQTITDWLRVRGFTVNFVYAGHMMIDFSGNAGQVRNAFHTSIHNFEVDGVHHIANVSDPQIPEALAPAIAGVVSMHDFKPHRMVRAQTQGVRAQYTSAYGEYVVPADLATIYDFNPLFTKGITGKGQTIVLIEDTDLFNPSDWTTFRKAFGLTTYTTGSLTTVNPAPAKGAGNCIDPGASGGADEGEAALDVEWASAAAPGAAIELASCTDTQVTFGGFIAAQNLVNSSSPPSIMSISYGECEAQNGASSNASFNSLYQQAAAEGTSVFVAAGDNAAAGCDPDTATSATHGIAVSGWASTPYNVAVGGTDFSDVYNNTVNKYWNLTTNTTTYGSALSYIPEIPWNDSCASILSAVYNGYSTAYGSSGFCSSSLAAQYFYLTVTGGGSGPSGCATGTPTVPGVVSGTCAGFAKPSWQAGPSGIPNDGMRDLPDVSMFASNGGWGHVLVYCWSDVNAGGATCRGAPVNWSVAGGTSFASPIMAGVQALVNQNAGSVQGNPNVAYYDMAVKVPSAFHPTTQGDNDINCGGPYNCFGYVGNLDYGRGGRVFATTYGGVLSVSNTSFAPAYTAVGTAWNSATGLGSVDVNNLVTNWTTK